MYKLALNKCINIKIDALNIKVDGIDNEEKYDPSGVE
jgi:hypothetical protein